MAMNNVRIVLKGNEGLIAREHDLTTTLGLYMGTYANVAAVEAAFTNTVPVGSTVIGTGGIFQRASGGGTANNWLTITES